MLRAVHDSGDPEAWVRERLRAGERLMGFGHRVYKVRDPRAEVLSAAKDVVGFTGAGVSSGRQGSGRGSPENT